MSDWYLSIDGEQVGPLDHADAVEWSKKNPSGLCWRQGYSEWTPIAHVGELRTTAASAAFSSPPPAANRMSDEIDFTLFGEDMQYVEIELDPGESTVAEAGSLMFKDTVIQMETIFGDGSQKAQSSGFLDKLVGAGKRLITGESCL